MSDDMRQAVCDASRPYAPTARSAFFGPLPSRVLQLPDNLTDLGAALEKKFPVAALLTASLYRQPPGEAPARANWFAPGDLFVPLRKKPKGAPFELVGEAGRLGSPGCVFEAACRDFSMWPQNNDRREIIVSHTLEEVDALQRFGFAATLSADLVELDGAGLTRLFGMPDPLSGVSYWSDAQRKRLGADSPARDANGVLLGWHVWELSAEPPEPLHAIVEFFAEANRTLGFRLNHWSIWRPTLADLEQFAGALRLRDVNILGAALWGSMTRSRVSIGGYRAQLLKSPPKAWDDAVRDSRRQLEHQLRRTLIPRNSTALKAARQNYLSCLRRAYLEPWRQRASTVPAEQRALCGQAADLVEQWLLLDALARRAEHAIGDASPAHSASQQDADRRAALAQQIERIILDFDRLERPRRARREPASGPLAAKGPTDAPPLEPPHPQREHPKHDSQIRPPQPR